MGHDYYFDSDALASLAHAHDAVVPYRALGHVPPLELSYVHQCDSFQSIIFM